MRLPPPRLAVIDIGSNAIRCLIAEGRDYTHSKILQEERVPLRLGHDAFLFGEIKPETQLEFLRTFVEWKLLFLKHEVTTVRAVATSALRNSKNRKSICAQVKKATGLEIEIISGKEEGRILRQVLLHRLPHVAPEALCMDVGGGSVEFSYQNHISSLPIGTVRLLEKVASKNEEDFRLYLRPYLLRLKSEMNLRKFPRSIIATGGNIKSLSRLAHRLHYAPSKTEFSFDAARKMTNKLFSLTFQERQRRLKLSKDRADVILPASCLVDEACRIFELHRVHAPQVGLKEGLLLDCFQRL